MVIFIFRQNNFQPIVLQATQNVLLNILALVRIRGQVT